jgi:hypothetical protein
MVFAVALAASTPVNTASGNIVAYWSFDDPEGSLARDSLGRGDGILKGNPEWTRGRFAGALSLDGYGDYVDCGGCRRPGDLKTWADVTNAMSVAAWVNIANVATPWTAIVTKGDSAWRLVTNENRRQFAFAVTQPQGGLSTAFGKIEVPAGVWQHVCGTYDGKTISLYINGTLDTSKVYSGVITNSVHNVCIGENEQAPGRCFSGLIDDVVIFDHALSKDEITQLYKRGAASFVSEDLVALADDVRKAKAIIREQTPQKAVAFLEKKTREYEQQKRQVSNNNELYFRQLVSNLHFLSAKAKEEAGLKSRDVVTDYKKSVSTSLGGSTYVPALLWLFENISQDDYVATAKRSARSDNYTTEQL